MWNAFLKTSCFNSVLKSLMLLRSQIVILKSGRGQHRKYLPYVFTEHGAIRVC